MGGRTFTNRRWSENPLPVTRFRWRKVSENSATHNPAFAILARTTCISGFFPPVFPDLMKSHITEFHVCGHVAESTQHVAFRQHLPSLHSLEAESRLSGCNDSRLHVDRPASLVSPQSRPDQNRPSPVGLRFVTSPLQHAAFGMVKSCSDCKSSRPPATRRSTVFACCGRKYDVRRSQQSMLRTALPGNTSPAHITRPSAIAGTLPQHAMAGPVFTWHD